MLQDNYIAFVNSVAILFSFIDNFLNRV